MSQGYSCKCDESRKPATKRNWVVLQRNGNCSAFNGYRWTYSDYSCVQCHTCGTVWRTKAIYVSVLPDGKNLYDLATCKGCTNKITEEQRISWDGWCDACIESGKNFDQQPEPAVVDKGAKTCESCKHCRPRTPQDRKAESGHDEDTFWCAVNEQPTKLNYLRCGGIDYEAKT